MSLPPKVVTVLGLVQFLFIAMGFGIITACLHIHDEVIPATSGIYAPEIPTLPAFIRAYGLWFVLVPITWSIFAACSGDTTNGVVSIPHRHLIIGIALAIGIGLFFLVGVLKTVSTI